MARSVLKTMFSLKDLSTGLFVLFIILVLAYIFLYILAYVFSAVAFYRFMKNRNINNAFLSWIPIVDVYTIGKVYDSINQTQNKKTYFGVIMLVIECFYWKLTLLPSGIFNFGLSFALLILELICYNLIFKTYTPNNKKYFVLTVIFSFIPIMPFIPSICLWKASKNRPIS